jgi:UDP-N-acetylmuramoylalanine--D-glutamate ligase
VAVLGLGASGRASARVLQAAGATVIGVDDAVPAGEDLPGVVPGGVVPGGVVPGGVVPGEALDVAGLDLVVASPGWPPDRRPLPEASARLPVWSEVELAWHLRARPHAPWLCVTGTNGKTTTVALAAAICRAAGLAAVAAGNIGRPLVEVATDPAVEVVVAELSSFQLHFTSSLLPRAAALLNLAPDHLDWHGSFDAYARAKARVADGVTDVVVIGPDPRLGRLLDRFARPAPTARRRRVTAEAPGPGEIGVVGDLIVERPDAGLAKDTPDAIPLARLDDLATWAPSTPAHAGPPPHLLLDALAAIALARSVGAGPAAIARGLRGFAIGEHRLTPVATIAGVTYIDDSKATNPHAAAAAFAGQPAGDVVWLAGGLTKGADVEELTSGIVHLLKGAVVIGTDRTAFVAALRRHAAGLPVVEVAAGDTGGVMRRAVRAARDLAGGRGTVLLAPAAASQDQFGSYAERGEAFARAVAELAAEECA